MKDSLWSLDLFRCESAVLRTHWVLVVTDQCTRLGPEVESRGTSRSAASRRVIAKTTAQLAGWQSAPLDALDVVVC